MRSLKNGVRKLWVIGFGAALALAPLFAALADEGSSSE